jgi:uncharacterized membrane protein (DUF4010 family)
MMPTDLIIKIQPFMIALTNGLIIGIERERSHPVGFQPLGLRTFVLFSILGVIAAYIKQPLVALAITAFVGAVVIAGYLRSSKKYGKEPDIGFTTEVAAVVTYGLGYLADSEPFLSLIIGVVVMVVLLARARLHQFSRIQLKPEELRATTILLVLAIGIIPFLPDKPIDPWLLIVPQRFGLLILMIAILQFSAYAGIRIFGARKGILLSGFLAGFVSSTTATATLSQQVKKGIVPDVAAALSIVLSTTAMLLKLLLIVYVTSPELLHVIALPIIVTLIVMGILVYFVGSHIKQTDNFPAPQNPLSLKAAIRLALFLGIMLCVVTLAQQHLGTLGRQAVVLIGSLVETNGVTLAIASLFHTEQISTPQALNSISLVVTGSLISKNVVIWTLAPGRYALLSSLLLALMLLIYLLMWGALTFWL